MKIVYIVMMMMISSLSSLYGMQNKFPCPLSDHFKGGKWDDEESSVIIEKILFFQIMQQAEKRRHLNPSGYALLNVKIQSCLSMNTTYAKLTEEDVMIRLFSFLDQTNFMCKTEPAQYPITINDQHALLQVEYDWDTRRPVALKRTS